MNAKAMKAALAELTQTLLGMGRSWCQVVPCLALAACGSASAPPIAPATPAPVIDAPFNVDNLSLHIHCVGDGAPVVILESGLGDDGAVWSDVQPDVARLTRVCAYDRAGTGSSSAAPRPHSSRQMVSELHTLLGLAGVKGPYVLVGHSLGGLNVRLFASEHPSEVAGMVLVDATTEEQDARSWSLMPEDAMRDFRAFLAEHPEGLDDETFRASMADVRNSKRSLGDMPLIVLTHGKEGPSPPGAPPGLGDRLARAWKEMQSELPRLSTNSAQITVENAGHYIHKDAPRLVVAAVQEVVRSARKHASIDAKPLSALAHDGSP